MGVKIKSILDYVKKTKGSHAMFRVALISAIIPFRAERMPDDPQKVERVIKIAKEVLKVDSLPTEITEVK